MKSFVLERALRIVLVLVIVIVIGGCASSTAPREPDESDFTLGAEHYKVTHEPGSSRWLLWHEEGISWRLVRESEKRGSPIAE